MAGDEAKPQSEQAPRASEEIPEAVRAYLDAKVGEIRALVVSGQRHLEKGVVENEKYLREELKRFSAFEEQFPEYQQAIKKIAEGEGKRLTKEAASSLEEIRAVAKEEVRRVAERARTALTNIGTECENNFVASMGPKLERMGKDFEKTAETKMESIADKVIKVVIGRTTKTVIGIGVIASLIGVGAVGYNMWAARKSASRQADSINSRIDEEGKARKEFYKEFEDFRKISEGKTLVYSKRLNEVDEQIKAEGVARRAELSSAVSGLEERVGRKVDAGDAGVYSKISEMATNTQLQEGLGRLSKGQEELGNYLRTTLDSYSSQISAIKDLAEKAETKDNYEFLRTVIEKESKRMEDMKVAIDGLYQDRRLNTEFRNSMLNELTALRKQYSDLKVRLEKHEFAK